MLHRTKSIERPRPPEPSYMTSQQTRDYLNDIRTSSQRIPRPQGARPPPPWMSRRSTYLSQAHEQQRPGSTEPPEHPPSVPQQEETNPLPPRSVSALSHHRTNSEASTTNTRPESQAGRPLVKQPQPPRAQRDFSQQSYLTYDSSMRPIYRERGDRWMEREEAASLRQALEDMDVADEEKRIHSAAQDEASELVWKHQNPNAAYQNPDKPYGYRGHLRRGSHARSLSTGRAPSDTFPSRSNSQSRRNSQVMQSGAPSIRSTRQVSWASGHSKSSTNSNESTGKTLPADEKPDDRPERKKVVDFDLPEKKAKPYDGLKGAPPAKSTERRRSTSGSKRNTSSGSNKGLFRNPEDQIYEEPDDMTPEKKASTPAQTPAPTPLQTRRNPFARVKRATNELTKAASVPSLSKPFNRVDIHRNPPSQSRNAEYTSNTARSTPPANSANAENSAENENEVKMKDGKELRSDDIRAATSMRLKDRSPKLPTPTYVSDVPGRPIVSFQQDWKPKEIELKEEVSKHSSRSVRPNLEKSGQVSASEPIVPTINVSDTFRDARKENTAPPPIPIINVPDEQPRDPRKENRAPPIPQINVSGTPSVPTINVGPPDVPSISVNGPSIPTINVSDGNSSKRPTRGSTRPLPIPSKTAPPLRNSRPHWTPSVRGSSALCSQCALPIAGRIVSAAGVRFHPECFTCHHCNEALECVAFYPEPEKQRGERLSRIQARMAGVDVPEEPGKTEAEDGDDSMRFFCHLDFHELFSPRCKSCKTPIEGEVVVACGAEWHVGHFFCAQCGDPFDSSTPFVEKDGYAWCVNCHTNRYSTKCRKCRKPVTETVVKALGAEWHAECFVCMECNAQFDDGRYFLRGEKSDPVCVKCEERRLKA